MRQDLQFLRHNIDLVSDSCEKLEYCLHLRRVAIDTVHWDWLPLPSFSYLLSMRRIKCFEVLIFRHFVDSAQRYFALPKCLHFNLKNGQTVTICWAGSFNRDPFDCLIVSFLDKFFRRCCNFGGVGRKYASCSFYFWSGGGCCALFGLFLEGIFDCGWLFKAVGWISGNVQRGHFKFAAFVLLFRVFSESNLLYILCKMNSLFIVLFLGVILTYAWLLKNLYTYIVFKLTLQKIVYTYVRIKLIWFLFRNRSVNCLRSWASFLHAELSFTKWTSLFWTEYFSPIELSDGLRNKR